MYNEEYLGDDAYDENDVSSYDSVSSIDTVIREQRRITKMYKQADPDYYTYKHIVDYKLKKVELYSTNMCKNGYIRHAISGARCPHRIGSPQEDLYFRVRDAFTHNKSYLEYGPRKLYYYSPEEFERHHNITISQSLKEDWMIKNLLANRLYNK
jgi:hypothetical protein